MIDVSKDTILRRSVPWRDERILHRIRYRLLVLDQGTRQERRYLASDVAALMSDDEEQSPQSTLPTVYIEKEPDDFQLVEPTPRASNLQEPAPQKTVASPGVEAVSAQATSQTGRPTHVEAGIYQNPQSRTYFERPHINGKRTWRSLKTKNLKLAREELHRRRAASSAGSSPYAPKATLPVRAKTAGEVIRRYQSENYPDRHLNTRPERTKDEEERHCELLLLFWNTIQVDAITIGTCDKYREWRLKRIKRGTGLRTIDRELNTLHYAFRYAVRREVLVRNPLTDRPKYQPSKLVVHCRQFMPGNADDLHEAASQLFKSRTSEVLGFQLLCTAYTGQRTCEILTLRSNAGPDEPGHVTGDGKCLRVWRAKGQDIVNPFCAVHEGLEALLPAHKAWLVQRYPNSTSFFPGRDGVNPVDKQALAHALLKLSRKGLIRKKITAHGARAFFVTVRRSQGAPDNQIAVEIGHTSGGSTLSHVYGGVPPDWVRGNAPKLTWLPSSAPAWQGILSHEDVQEPSVVPETPPKSTIEESVLAPTK